MKSFLKIGGLLLVMSVGYNAKPQVTGSTRYKEVHESGDYTCHCNEEGKKCRCDQNPY